DTDFDAPPTNAPTAVARTYRGNGLPDLLFTALTDSFAEDCWSDLRGTVELAAARIEASSGKNLSRPQLEIIPSVFYRGRGAYLVGRVLRGEESPLPIALCLRHENERGITLDAALHGD